MRIVREDEHGGRFTAPLWLNVKISFKPVDGVSREDLEVPVAVRFPADPNVPWRSKSVAPVPAGFVLVDTDGDRAADTYLPGTSNFIAGQSSRPASRKPGAAGAAEKRGQWICHSAPEGHQHCFWLCDGCQIP